jgi:hypothetical protein
MARKGYSTGLTFRVRIVPEDGVTREKVQQRMLELLDAVPLWMAVEITDAKTKRQVTSAMIDE